MSYPAKSRRAPSFYAGAAADRVQRARWCETEALHTAERFQDRLENLSSDFKADPFRSSNHAWVEAVRALVCWAQEPDLYGRRTLTPRQVRDGCTGRGSGIRWIAFERDPEWNRPLGMLRTPLAALARLMLRRGAPQSTWELDYRDRELRVTWARGCVRFYLNRIDDDADRVAFL